MMIFKQKSFNNSKTQELSKTPTQNYMNQSHNTCTCRGVYWELVYTLLCHVTIISLSCDQCLHYLIHILFITGGTNSLSINKNLHERLAPISMVTRLTWQCIGHTLLPRFVVEWDGSELEECEFEWVWVWLVRGWTRKCHHVIDASKLINYSYN